MKNTIKILSIVTGLTVINVAVASDNYIYKFKDSNGKTIYTDRMPADEKGQFAVLSSKSGIIKKVVDKELTADGIKARDEEQAKTKEKTEKTEAERKKDVVLLNSYSNVEEIDKIKKYELDQIDQGLKNSIDNIATVKDKLDQLTINKNSSPNNANIQKEYNKTLDNLNSLQKTLDNSKSMYADRESKYNNDKIRYLELLKEMATKN